ncbi:UDP-3-O-acyl-N-acetylglucosamine deacetylase, partial [bacterium]|nr:UDP-3-O-acyl-N-acetylglucosamine deacetylase [bacterium]
MRKQQQTLKRVVRYTGAGIHTGNPVTMTWHPAPVDHGIKFIRVDLESRPVVEPRVANVRDVTRWTTISQNGVVVHTVEHVLSALHGLGVDNLLIELDGSETPVGDGSALPWVRLIEEAGLQPQEGVREVYQPREMLHAELGD